MSICAVWIISLDAKLRGTKNLVFSRHYPVVLKKAKDCGFLLKAQLPNDEDIANAILEELQIYRTSSEFVSHFDSCMLYRQAPMYSIMDDTIWPIVAISKSGLTFACLPLLEMERGEKRKLKCKEIGPVTIAYSLLQNIADVVCSGHGELVTEEKLQELRDYLFMCMPFGTPREMDPATIRGILSTKDPVLIPKQKVPAWRPVAYKGKQHIHLFIQESIRCVQYDKPGMSDICDVYGTILCKAELEGAPEVSFDLISASDSQALENTSFHHCVQLSDALSTSMPVDDDKSMTNDYSVRSIRFCPPIENFHLCHYKSLLEEPPILAYYQMTDRDDCAKIKVSLKLWKKMKNSFDYLRISIPFFNRKSIRRVDCSPVSANLNIFDKNTIIWNVGSRFPSKTLEIFIEGTVYFSTTDEKIVKHDKFCTGLNSYILVRCKTVYLPII